MQEAKKLKLMEAETYERAIELPKIKGSARLQGRTLSRGEIGALMAVCLADRSPIMKRFGMLSYEDLVVELAFSKSVFCSHSLVRRIPSSKSIFGS